jgi:hypothetical protein
MIFLKNYKINQKIIIIIMIVLAILIKYQMKNKKMVILPFVNNSLEIKNISFILLPLINLKISSINKEISILELNLLVMIYNVLEIVNYLLY